VNVALAGLALALLGFVAMAAAPKGSGSGDPYDDAVQPWTAVMFFGGLVLALLGLGADALADRLGWPLAGALGLIVGGIGMLAGWGWAVHRLTRRRPEKVGQP
jgi:hypothetical protein